MDTLLQDIETFCDANAMSEWRFGDAALKDRHFVSELRGGREPRRMTVARVRSFMAGYRS